MSQFISILYTSDTHGQWVPREDHDKLSLIDTAMTLTEIRNELKHPVISIDLGDFSQGSGIGTYCSSVIQSPDMFARVMNALNYDYQIIGNHEFNYGHEYRNRLFNQLNAEILAANIINEQTGDLVHGKPYDIIEIGGIKIGIIGVTTSYIKHWELPKNYSGLEFPDAFDTTKYYVEMLRSLVDIVVVAYHGGFEKDLMTFEPIEEITGENQGAKMLEEIEGIDILLTGHQHRELVGKCLNTVYLQPGYAGEYIGEARIALDDRNNVLSIEGILHKVDKKEKSDRKILDALSPDFQNGLDWLNTSIGNCAITSPITESFIARLNGHPYAELLNQIQFDETQADFSAVSIVNDSFKNLIGEITNEKLLIAYPFYNLIAKVSVTGQELYEIMEFNLSYFIEDEFGNIVINPDKLVPKPQHYNYDLYSGIQTFVDFHQPIGHRVEMIIDENTEKPLNLDQYYTLAISQYRAVGGGNYHWFNQDKIISISQEDIASLLKVALKVYDDQRWDEINTNYQHLVYKK